MTMKENLRALALFIWDRLADLAIGGGGLSRKG